jgi:D-serine deaminase-like pyridoxal phosphate-dependent protein
MRHSSIDDLRQQADVEPVVLPMDRRTKLLRWAELLETQPRRVQALIEIEWQPRAERAAARADRSAIAVAFADPALRAAGLAGDRFGDAQAFFELSDRDAHAILCSCRLGAEPMSGRVAAELRRVADREALWEAISARLWAGIAAAVAATTVAAAVLT